MTWTWHDTRKRPKIRFSFFLSARHRQVHIVECISELICLRCFLLSISIHFNTLEKVICHYNTVIYLALFFGAIWPLVWDLIFHSSSLLLRSFSLGLFKWKTVNLHVMFDWVGSSFFEVQCDTLSEYQYKASRFYIDKISSDYWNVELKIQNVFSLAHTQGSDVIKLRSKPIYIPHWEEGRKRKLL